MSNIDIEEFGPFHLSEGSHEGPEDGMCVMEMVSFLAGEEWSDCPDCTSPVIASFCRVVNDNMSQEYRNKLQGYVPKLMGTKSPEHEQERAEYLAWQAVKVFAPTALELAGLVKEADDLRCLDQKAGLLAAYNVAYDVACRASDAAHEAYNTARYPTSHAASHACNNAYRAAHIAARNAASDAAYTASKACQAAHDADCYAEDVQYTSSEAAFTACGAAYTTANTAAYTADAVAQVDEASLEASLTHAGVWDEVLRTLDGVLEIGKKSPPVIPPEKIEKLKELIGVER